jgi:transcriptional regulator with XRE-family HTH domain
MGSVTKLNRTKQLRRPHHIVDWAEKRALTQAEIANEIGADKSVVSRWFGGATPSEEYQEKLAALFGADDPEAIFRHPDDDWLRRFFEGLDQDEIDRAKRMLEAAFPKKRA